MRADNVIYVTDLMLLPVEQGPKEYSRRCRRERRRRERRLDAVVKVLEVVSVLMLYGALVCAATVVWLG